jgi:hypothetical protein
MTKKQRNAEIAAGAIADDSYSEVMLEYIHRIALPFAPADGLIGPAVLMSSNGCPPPVVASVTKNPCTYTHIGTTYIVLESAK